MMDTAKEAMKPVTWGAPRMGLKAPRSMRIPTTAPEINTREATAGNGTPSFCNSPRVINAPISAFLYLNSTKR